MDRMHSASRVFLLSEVLLFFICSERIRDRYPKVTVTVRSKETSPTGTVKVSEPYVILQLYFPDSRSNRVTAVYPFTLY
jgi:hypothetical protein